MKFAFATAFAALLVRKSFAIDDFVLMEGHNVQNDYSSPLPYEYISESELPAEFDWGNVDGKSYLTHMVSLKCQCALVDTTQYDQSGVFAVI